MLTEEEALRRIADGEPDERLAPELERHVQALARLGWLGICGCSDGDYVVVTKLGREVLATKPE